MWLLGPPPELYRAYGASPEIQNKKRFERYSNSPGLACTGDLPADRQALRRHFVAPASSRLPSCLTLKPPPRWQRYKMTGLCTSPSCYAHSGGEAACRLEP